MRVDVNHRSQDTTSIAEGWHSSVKGWVRTQGSENLRVDRLVHFLLTWVGGLCECKDMRGQHGARQIAECIACLKNCGQIVSNRLMVSLNHKTACFIPEKGQSEGDLAMQLFC
jgi:hypothetical protein